MPAAKASRIPGTKWWMWRPRILTLRNGPHWSRIPQVERRTGAKAPRNPASRLKRTVSLRGAAA